MPAVLRSDKRFSSQRSPNTSYFIRVTGAPLTAPPAASASAAINTYDLNFTANLDDLGPQIIDPDGPAFPAQAIQIVDNPFFDLFTNNTCEGTCRTNAADPRLDDQLPRSDQPYPGRCITRSNTSERSTPRPH